MFPYLINYSFFQIHTFWLSITISFFLFLWMLHRMSKRLNYDFNVFYKNMLWFVLSVFFFSRLFYIISKWHDLKYIQSFTEFFIMTDYNFSLLWAVFWFFLVLIILLKIRKENINKYIYWVVLSFIFVLPIWFFGALLWWQVYWTDTNFWIEITYTRNDTPVNSTSPLFPLPIVYWVLFFLLFCGLYIANMYFKEKELLWYWWMMIFACIIFIFEFFSWKNDIFKDVIIINLNQIFAIIILLTCAYKVYKLYKKETRRWIR